MYTRSDRLKELFREELVKILRDVKDPGVSGLLTVTDLTLSKDNKTASVFWSVIGSQRQRQSTAQALERAAPFIRTVMRKRLTLKFIPHLVFVFDETPQKASRIEKLLIDLRKKEEGR